MGKKKEFIDKTGRKWDSESEHTMFKWLTEAGWKEEEDFIVQGKFIPGRRFRGDFVFYKEKIIVEVMGLDLGGFAGHNSPWVMAKDYIRDMIATTHGWRIIYWCKGVTKTDLLYYLDLIIKS